MDSKVLCFLVTVVTGLLMLFYQLNSFQFQLSTKVIFSMLPSVNESTERFEIHLPVTNVTVYNLTISMTCCGEDRIQETLTSMKSAILFSKSPITFYIFTNPKYFSNFSSLVLDLPQKKKERVELVLNEVKYPETVEAADWRILFKPCASLRLFLPDMLENTDAVLYVDTDAVFLSPVENLWEHFYKMNSSQLAGVGTDDQSRVYGWYKHRSKHPYYGQYGINSGVILMNLTKMRDFNWTQKIIPLKNEYIYKIKFGDQDILNIFFHFNPDLVYLLDCSYNYRPDHCIYGVSACREAETSGVKVMHANKRAADEMGISPFMATYRALMEMNLRTDDLMRDLYIPLRRRLSLSFVTDQHCGGVSFSFIRNMGI